MNNTLLIPEKIKSKIDALEIPVFHQATAIILCLIGVTGDLCGKPFSGIYMANCTRVIVPICKTIQFDVWLILT